MLWVSSEKKQGQHAELHLSRFPMFWFIIGTSLIITVVLWNIKYDVPKDYYLKNSDDMEFLFYTDEFIDHDF